MTEETLQRRLDALAAEKAAWATELKTGFDAPPAAPPWWRRWIRIANTRPRRDRT